MERNEGTTHPNLRPNGDGLDPAHTVKTVVDAVSNIGWPHAKLMGAMGQHAQRPETKCNGSAIRALVLGTFWIDVQPVVIFSRLAELVDQALFDEDPI